MCAVAERAASKALANRDNLNNGMLRDAFLLGVCSHRAMDVPKHYSAEQIVSLSQKLARKAKVKREDKRSSMLEAENLRFTIQNFNRKEPWRNWQDQLLAHVQNDSLGQVWVGNGLDLVLKADAGKEIRRILLSRIHGQMASERTSDRSPLMEIAQLLAHRLRQGGSVQKLLLNNEYSKVLEVLKKSRKNPIGSLRSLMNSALP